MPVTKQQLSTVIKDLKSGDYKCYFFLPDFEKHSGGIQYVYNHVKRMNQEGYNAIVLHQKVGFKPEWLIDWFEQDEDGNFIDIPIQYLDEQDKLEIKMEDFFFIPEGFPQLMDNLKNAPCKRIVFCLNWYYVLNALNPGTFWDSYGIRDCMSITDSQSEYLKMIMPFLRLKKVDGQIDSEVYHPPESMTEKRMQVAFIPSRDGGAKSNNAIKTFYSLFPYFRFVKFVELSGMDKDTFAFAMRESAFYAHFDEASSWGTAPIEAWNSGCLVAGWDGVGGREFMSSANTWLAPNGDIVRLALAMGNMIETYIMNSVPEEMLENMKEQCERYTPETERASIIKVHKEYKEERIAEIESLINFAPDEADVPKEEKEEKEEK